MTTKKTAIELAELVLRCDEERANAASLAHEGNTAAAAEAEERADSLYDEIIDMAREVVTKANREADKISKHVRQARKLKRDEMRAWANLSRRDDVEDDSHHRRAERYQNIVRDYQCNLRAITAAIKAAIRAETSPLKPLDEGFIAEMRENYLSNPASLPVTNYDVWDYYDTLISTLLD